MQPLWLVLSVSCSALRPADIATCDKTPLNCTEEFQALLDRSSYVRIEEGVWPTAPLHLRSHQIVELGNGAELSALRGGFEAPGACLLSAHNVHNVTLRGMQAQSAAQHPRLQMHKDEYAQSGVDVSHKHVLSIANASDIVVQGPMVLAGAGGDGIYIASHSGKAPRPLSLIGSERVVLRGLTVSNNSRNGMSVIGCVDCLVEDCRFQYTGDGFGSEPMAGVDIEPNSPQDAISNVTFKRCASIGNGGGGFEMYLGQWSDAPPPLPLIVKFDDALVDGEGVCRRPLYSPGCGGFLFDLLGPNLRGGHVSVHGSLIRRTVDPPIMLGGVAAEAGAVSFHDMTVFAPVSPVNQRVSSAGTAEAVPVIAVEPGLAYAIGGVSIVNSTIIDPRGGGDGRGSGSPLLLKADGFNVSAGLGVRDVNIEVSVVGASACQAAQRAARGPPLPGFEAVTVHVVCSEQLRASCRNASDCRPELQAVIESGASRVILKRGGGFDSADVAPPLEPPALPLPPHAAPLPTILPASAYPMREPGLWLTSNTALLLEDGVALVAASGAFISAPEGISDPDGLNMVVVKNVQNATVAGMGNSGAMIQMRKSEYNAPSRPEYQPKPSAGRMGVLLRNCTDIVVANLTIDSTGGDGIYVGRNHEPSDPISCVNQSTACHGVAQRVAIHNVRSTRNSRQGMSVVAAVNLMVTNSEFSYTQGACPQAGIDIEPSSGAEPVHNVSLVGVTLRNNTGTQLQLPVDPFPLAPGGLPLRVELERIHVFGANWSATNDGCSGAGLGINVGPIRSVGSVELRDSIIEQTPSAGLLLQSKALATIDAKGELGTRDARVLAAGLLLSNVTFNATALRPMNRNGTTESPLVFSATSAQPFANWTLGNITLSDVTVDDVMGQPWLSAAVVGPYSDTPGVWGVSSVRGRARVLTHGNGTACNVHTGGGTVFDGLDVDCEQWHAVPKFDHE